MTVQVFSLNSASSVLCFLLPTVLTLIPADDAHIYMGMMPRFAVYLHKIKSFSFEDCCRIFNNKTYVGTAGFVSLLKTAFWSPLSPQRPSLRRTDEQKKGNQHLQHQQLLLEVSHPKK